MDLLNVAIMLLFFALTILGVAGLELLRGKP